MLPLPPPGNSQQQQQQRLSSGRDAEHWKHSESHTPLLVCITDYRHSSLQEEELNSGSGALSSFFKRSKTRKTLTRVGSNLRTVRSAITFPQVRHSAHISHCEFKRMISGSSYNGKTDRWFLSHVMSRAMF